MPPKYLQVKPLLITLDERITRDSLLLDVNEARLTEMEVRHAVLREQKKVWVDVGDAMECKESVADRMKELEKLVEEVGRRKRQGVEEKERECVWEEKGKQKK